MADRLSLERRSWNMSRIKSKNTKPEIIFRSLLHKSGFRYRLHDKKLPGKPDIVLPKYQSVIFVNGCFWHRHENCNLSYTPKSRQDFWDKKFSDTVIRDQKKIDLLKEAGWNVITVWECELNSNSEGVLKRTISKIKKAVVNGN
ncbi:MAG TPA: very short patch repair endonuclease [Ginsengibacter sp.]|nr:very short patch repair endonuclease [Ginsengibacter sp.]